MTPKEAEDLWEKQKINVFDLTHIWPQKQFPLRKVGEFVLNENAVNYFAEVEQVAFSPSHLVPGIEPSADPVLQSRLFSYADTHRHRVGTNYQQLPVNAPRTGYKFGNFQRDGSMAFYNQGARPNYLSSIDPIQFKERKVDPRQDPRSLHRSRHQLPFRDPRGRFQRSSSLVGEGLRRNQPVNVGSTMLQGKMEVCKDKEILKRQIAIFRMVSDDIASRLEKAIGIKGYPDIYKMRFNGTHNGMAKDTSVRNANGMKDTPSNGNKDNINAGPISGSHAGIAVY